MEYLDMYLVHWPVKLKPWVNYPVPNEDDFEKLDIEATWAGMEKCLEMGLCRCIGVSNFSSKKIEWLLDFASTPPDVNQVCTFDHHLEEHLYYFLTLQKCSFGYMTLK